jgi:hypothetical protein
MRTAYHMVVFAGDPLTAMLGFLMFRYPQACAKMNARLSHKELYQFGFPKQLASTRRLGILVLILTVFSLLSLLAVNVLAPLK